MPTASLSSSPAAENRLLRLPLEQLHAHPANANVMNERQLAKLAANIAREGRYPPMIVRPHPELAGQYQLLDGHQRLAVLSRLGHREAVCYEWPCDDATALVLLATLNRLAGEDVPARRADLLATLSALISVDDLALLLPEDAGAIRDTLALRSLDSAELLARLDQALGVERGDAPRAVTFALTLEQEAIVEKAIAEATAGIEGANRRGRALTRIAEAYLEAHRG